MIIARKHFAIITVEDQNRLWNLGLGSASIKITEFICILAGLILIVCGALLLLGVVDVR